MTALVGTSGWSYPSGRGTWNGIFYPPRRRRGFDELAYYAERFETVEINATFYRVPEAAMSESWVRRTPDRFLFAVKLFQKFTHPRMYLKRHEAQTWDVSRDDIDLFRRGVAPIADAGRLVALLVQFPPSFAADSATGAYLTWLLESLSGYPLAVELRHASWNAEGGSTQALLSAAGATRVLEDSPVSAPVTADAIAAVTSPSLVYVRLHGRNRANWWRHDESEDRYDYHYSEAEIAGVADTVRAAARGSRRVAVYFNNHFSAKAVANAAILRHQLDGLVPADFPAALVHRYPELAGVVRTGGLF